MGCHNSKEANNTNTSDSNTPQSKPDQVISNQIQDQKNERGNENKFQENENSNFHKPDEVFFVIRVNPLEALPDDCVSHIFTFLEIRDQMRCCVVSKEFHRLMKRTWDWTHQTLAIEFIITRENKRRELIRKYYIQQIKKMQESKKKVSQLSRQTAISAPRGQK